jgi:beta-N-acetylhexosaminidase
VNGSPTRLQPIHALLGLVGVVVVAGLLLAALFISRETGSGTTAVSDVTPLRATSMPTVVPTPTLLPVLVETFAPQTATPSPPILPSTTPTAEAMATLTPTSPAESADELAIEALLARLTVEQKLGQMQIVGLPGTGIDPLTRGRIAVMGIGGVIFLERNTDSPEQVRELTQALQQLAIEQGPGLPLFIGWNHEGGAVVRHRAGLTRFPSAMALGALGEPQTTLTIAQAAAEEMSSLGVNMNFAPVLDVNSEPANPVIGLRAFGDRTEPVVQQGIAYIQGQQQAGVIGVAKHFPGHGNVTVDSHLALPTMDSTLDDLWLMALPPFQRAIEVGVPAIMVAHIRLPNIEPDAWPASLSPVVITTLLREELGYDGVIMTDELGMDAILENYPLGEAAVQALLAGNDLLLTVETANHPEIVHQALLQAVQSGRISEARIDESLRRLIRLKLDFDLGVSPVAPLLTNQPEHQELARRAGAAAVTVIQDAPGLLPLRLPTNLILISPEKLNPGTVIGDRQSGLGEGLAAAGATVTELFYDHESPGDIMVVQNQALALADMATVYVVVTWDANLRFAQYGEVAQEVLVRTVFDTERPVIVVFGQLPYDRERLRYAPVQLASYGDSDGQIDGLVTHLVGNRLGNDAP